MGWNTNCFSFWDDLFLHDNLFLHDKHWFEIKKDQGFHHQNGGLQFRKLEIRPVTEIYDVIPRKIA